MQLMPSLGGSQHVSLTSKQNWDLWQKT